MFFTHTRTIKPIPKTPNLKGLKLYHRWSHPVSADGCFCRKQKMTCGRPTASLKHIFSAIYFKIRLAVHCEHIFALSQASTCQISLPNSNNTTKQTLQKGGKQQQQVHLLTFGCSDFCMAASWLSC